MVEDCPQCGEHAFATRIADRPPLICRACRYYRDSMLDEEGYDTAHEINDRPLNQPPEHSPHYDESEWDWERHEPEGNS